MKSLSKIGLFGAVGLITMASAVTVPSFNIGDVTFVGNEAIAQNETPPQMKVAGCKKTSSKAKTQISRSKVFQKSC